MSLSFVGIWLDIILRTLRAGIAVFLTCTSTAVILLQMNLLYVIVVTFGRYLIQTVFLRGFHW